MFTRCLFCHKDFDANETLEGFPLSRKVAFDPGRGRLWAVCGTCHRWNLAPMDERWEALEELEKLTRDKARMLAQTDNISLLRTGEMEIVRVGNAKLAEEAWWRYGRELLRRNHNYKLLTAAGIGLVGVVVVAGSAAGITVGGAWWGLWRLSKVFPMLGRTMQFGTTAWEGEMKCPHCGTELREIPFRQRGVLVTRPEPDNGISLTYRCPRCWLPRRHGASPSADMGDRDAGFRFQGVEAEQLLRRILAYHHYAGATEPQIMDASRLIQDAGSARSLSVKVAARRRELVDLDPTEAFALEIAVNEEAERRMLELELAALEERWRQEEELASIIDGELTPMPRPDEITTPGDAGRQLP